MILAGARRGLAVLLAGAVAAACSPEPDPVDLEALSEVLSSDEYATRLEAMESVSAPASLGTGFLTRQLRDNPYPEVREWAADQLGRLRDPAAVSALIRALRAPENRAKMARIVTREGKRTYVESARDRDVQTAIIQALVEIGSPAVPHLREVVHTGDSELRSVALWGLYRLGEEPELEEEP